MNRYQRLAKQVAEDLDPDVRGALATDPFTTVENAFDLKVALRDETPEGCSCAGSYDAERRTIFVAVTPFSRRSRFTCLHELFHHLVDIDENLLLEVIELHPSGRGRPAEEKVCDAFAAEILLPDPLVDGVLAGCKPEAQHLLKLFERSHASREACAVRLSQRLGGEGHVMLAALNGTAIFTASASTYTVARGVPQGAGHITSSAARHGKARGETFVRFGSGAEKPLWGDAVTDGQFVYAVLVDTPTWEVSGVRIHRRAFERPAPSEVECPRCGHSYETWERPCGICGIQLCPHCGRCGCRAEVREKACSKCHLVKPSRQFPAGSDQCADCA